jgi:hypothetical protein
MPAVTIGETDRAGIALGVAVAITALALEAYGIEAGGALCVRRAGPAAAGRQARLGTALVVTRARSAITRSIGELRNDANLISRAGVIARTRI